MSTLELALDFHLHSHLYVQLTCISSEIQSVPPNPYRMYGSVMVELCSLKRYTQDLTPATYENDLIWK